MSKGLGCTRQVVTRSCCEDSEPVLAVGEGEKRRNPLRAGAGPMCLRTALPESVGGLNRSEPPCCLELCGPWQHCALALCIRLFVTA